MINILILSDGKAGHLNQSLAIAKRIKGAEIKIVKPGWNKISKLLKIKADLVISTGAKLVFYNYFLGKLKGAKRIVCQRTSPFPSFLFDLVILPFHDLYPKDLGFDATKSHIMVVSGAPNLISPEYVEKEAIRLKKDFSLLEKDYLGLIFGGDSRYFYLDKEKTLQILENSLLLAKERNLSLLVTTSRRTKKEVEDFIYQKTKNENLVSLFIPASKQKESPVAGILGLSKLVIVTGESVSMVSESASSGRPTLAVRIKKKVKKITKQDIFLKNLERKNYIKAVEVGEIYSKGKEILEGKMNIDTLNESEMVAKRVESLL